jgi:hypothetical protein
VATNPPFTSLVVFDGRSFNPRFPDGLLLLFLDFMVSLLAMPGNLADQVIE